MQDINSKRGKKHLDNGPGQFSVSLSQVHSSRMLFFVSSGQQQKSSLT